MIERVQTRFEKVMSAATVEEGRQRFAALFRRAYDDPKLAEEVLARKSHTKSASGRRISESCFATTTFA